MCKRCAVRQPNERKIGEKQREVEQRPCGAREMQQRTPFITGAIALLDNTRPLMNMTMATLGKFARRAGPRVMAL